MLSIKEKNILNLVVLLVIALSFFKPTKWHVDKIDSSYEDYKSKRLTYLIEKPFGSIEIEVLFTKDIAYGYINSLSQKFGSKNTKTINLNIGIDNKKYESQEILLTGNQRIKLSNETTSLLLDNIVNSKIFIFLENSEYQIDPLEKSIIKKLSK